MIQGIQGGYLQEEELEKVKMVAVTVTDFPQVTVCFHLSGLAYSSWISSFLSYPSTDQVQPCLFPSPD